ncbi:MAG: lipid-A-disaccharide synthase [Gammaproteobacteria bacterium]
MMRVAVVAGEASGDALAAGLIRALRQRIPDMEVEGVGGEELRKAGCRILYPLDKLAVMGLFEVLGSWPELARMRRRLIEHFYAFPPDIFIGVDAPDFNLALEEKLRSRGIPTVHYVSPSVWAWRRYRIRRIRRAVDLMLVLFPFEDAFYRQHGVPVSYVGHPLADSIQPEVDSIAARRNLGLDERQPLIALMPGSRRGELDRMLKPMLLTAARCRKERNDLGFIGSLLTDEALAKARRAQSAPDLEDLPLRLFRDRAQEVMAAADVVLLASGTVALEAMLLKKPMVVTYRVNVLSYYLLRLLIRTEFISLPNILAGEEVVPEFLQQDCCPEKLAPALMAWLDNPERTAVLRERFQGLHRQLARDADRTGAEAVMKRFNLS